MKFEEALQALREGKIIRRPVWINDVSMTMDDRELWYLLTPDFDYRRLIPIDKKGYAIDSEDLLAEDWEIV